MPVAPYPSPFFPLIGSKELGWLAKAYPDRPVKPDPSIIIAGYTEINRDLPGAVMPNESEQEHLPGGRLPLPAVQAGDGASQRKP
ncbi:hypothetical protein Cpha266_0888 [Chlorobium phaeobacteroides DSM 266]|uniref:Uncharacterized protein n=1 Tax=Chlorobium phaeobacteroides (strain DSM 266 / SMG 266 / 2430) TaxID=290317 RepID=A1BEV9_CHLPD|nr:hypothetical protein Cpha266_0888 [Chlorobium phaeobacteroides DSM 266]